MLDMARVHEAFEASGTPRPWARAALEAVARADPASLPDRITRSLTRAGVRFSSVEGDLQFYVDPVPLVQWNRVISLILPSTSAYTSIVTLPSTTRAGR